MPRRPQRLNTIKATCHPDRPHYAKGLCSPCYQGVRKQKNPEAIKQYQRDAYLSNPDRVKANSRKWRAANPEPFAKLRTKWLKFSKSYKRLTCAYCGEKFWLRKSVWRWRMEERGLKRGGDFYCSNTHASIMKGISIRKRPCGITDEQWEWEQRLAKEGLGEGRGMNRLTYGWEEIPPDRENQY
jgi:hypothetical protein